jgi:predicted anti-sigma-YlaC factor YlaD
MLSKIFSKQLGSCDWVSQQFSEYVDGVLNELDRKEVHEHLKFCDYCTDELDQFCKTLSLLADFREECMPAAIQNYRLPRSTFVEIFPSIRRKERPPLTLDMLVPYAYAFLIMFVVLSTWDLWEKHDFQTRYNASNYIKVVAKI